ncbi:MAG: SDR family NAD(P)-dependent oxidoreductase [Xanthomonadales bacterium]|nr:SDR family NAD(P)-dependent oxidoreductase [Xanthomonadales bacterium]
MTAAERWRGRVVLVSGATGALGRSLASSLARLGAEPVLLARRAAALAALAGELETRFGRSPGLCPLDLERASPGDYEALAASLEREYGRLDAILHAAAHFRGLAPLEHTEPVEWLRGLHVNLSAPLFLTLACLPLLRRGTGGEVAFMLEGSGLASRPLYGAYGIAKGALEMLVGMLGRELASAGIRVRGVRLPPTASALRARAWFAEDPATLSPAERTAERLLERLASEADELLDLEPQPLSAIS